MILEAIVAATCFYGNSDACNSSLTGYVKYNKLDQQAEIVEQNIKKKYPTIHFTGMTLGTLVYKKYNAMLYNNIWYQGDFSNSNDIKNMIVYKYSF